MTEAIERARALLAGSRRVASFSGAGLSAESGIPTFRDPVPGGDGEALWSRYDPMRLASPEGFAESPEVVLDWYAWRRRMIAGAAPNAAHRALAGMRDVVHVTQNVDDLLERAGAARERVVHLHGTITRDRCHATCGFEEEIDPASPPAKRPCPRCGAPVRPAVVWFGEILPVAAWSAAERECAACELLLVVGTSAVVYPAAGLIRLAKSAHARVVVVNPQTSDASALADVELTGPAGEIVPALLD